MLLSVVIPVYNDEKYLEKCLLSIVKQTYKEFEVILVDDGSTDNSGNICDCFCKSDKRFKVVHKNNSGVCEARNRGLDIASGDYICFIDSDDWIEDDYFETVEPLLSTNNYSIVFNPIIIEKLNGKVLESSINYSHKLTHDEAVCCLFRENLFPWGAVCTFYKNDLIKNVRFNHQSCFGEDFEFKYKAIRSAKGDLYYSNIAKYHYMVRNDSACVSYSILKKCDDLRIIKNVMSQEKTEFKDILFYKQYIPRLLTYALIGTSSCYQQEYSKGLEFRKEAICYKWKILFSSKVSLYSKVKLLILMSPLFFRKKLSMIYISLKSNNF